MPICRDFSISLMRDSSLIHALWNGKKIASRSLGMHLARPLMTMVDQLVASFVRSS